MIKKREGMIKTRERRGKVIGIGMGKGIGNGKGKGMVMGIVRKRDRRSSKGVRVTKGGDKRGE